MPTASKTTSWTGKDCGLFKGEVGGHEGDHPSFQHAFHLGMAHKRNDGLHGRMNVRTVRHVIAIIARKALGDAEGSRIHPHLFRHHMGFLMNEKGGITAVQKQLAHRNIGSR